MRKRINSSSNPWTFPGFFFFCVSLNYLETKNKTVHPSDGDCEIKTITANSKETWDNKALFSSQKII